MSDPVPNIEVGKLTKRFGDVTAIRDVSFSVAHGEIVGFLGPNGAGKSTTLRILCGLIPASSGVARICGIPVASRPVEIKRRIGYMAENNPLPEEMRVVEYLDFRSRLKGIRGRGRKRRVEEVMTLCELNRTNRKKVIGTLSKGYRQRVGIADAILGEPEVIIMDEPTIGLDPHQILAIRDLIDTLRGTMSVVLSSHILAEVELSCDRIIIINQGRIVANGSADRLRREFVDSAKYVLSFRGDSTGLLSSIKALDPYLHAFTQKESQSDGIRKIVFESSSRGDLSEKIMSTISRHPEARVRSLVRAESSLEDIFLAATKRSWDETL